MLQCLGGAAEPPEPLPLTARALTVTANLAARLPWWLAVLVLLASGPRSVQAQVRGADGGSPPGQTSEPELPSWLAFHGSLPSFLARC